MWRHRVFCNVLAYVSCRGYIGILMSARVSRESKVAPRIVLHYSSLTEHRILSGTFFFSGPDKSRNGARLLRGGKWNAADKTMVPQRDGTD